MQLAYLTKNFVTFWSAAVPPPVADKEVLLAAPLLETLFLDKSFPFFIVFFPVF
jgi:hypothetical protein